MEAVQFVQEHAVVLSIVIGSVRLAFDSVRAVRTLSRRWRARRGRAPRTTS
ncbi:hypothetical protein ACIBCM_34385 [Streptomyces sp. NPDC051018]|uniref:hypothetical protein n=1 Tax=Streptomyces sp. NPDC051018 TaxID=3365639 RepID=UPI0037A151C2